MPSSNTFHTSSLLKFALVAFVSASLAGITAVSANEVKPAAKKKAMAKKSKESVKKIAVGPSPTPTQTPQIEPANAAAATVESEDTDSIDQPIPKTKIESTDAPGVKLEANETPLGASTSGKVLEKSESANVGDTEDVEDAAPISDESPKATSSTQPVSSPVSSPAPSPAVQATPLAAAVTAASPTQTTDIEKNPVSADQSLKWLLNGNTRFVNKAFRADGRGSEERIRSSAEQKPHAIILACSESVTPPELIFDQGIGEITTIRVAGPQLDSAVISSLEQAVRNFDTHLILVLGHTQCSSLEGSPYIGRKQLDPHSKNEVEAALNADGIARDLTSKSEFLKARVEAKQLTIKSALYWVDTGKVKLY